MEGKTPETAKTTGKHESKLCGQRLSTNSLLSKHRESRDSDTKEGAGSSASGKAGELLGGTRASIQKLMESKHSDFLPKRSAEGAHHSVNARDFAISHLRLDKDKRGARGRKSKDRTASASAAARSQKTASLSQNRKLQQQQ